MMFASKYLLRGLAAGLIGLALSACGPKGLLVLRDKLANPSVLETLSEEDNDVIAKVHLK